MDTMNVERVRARIADIAKEAKNGDSERAHSREDKLFEDVLQAIADGCEAPSVLAREALESIKLDFPRWCA